MLRLQVLVYWLFTTFNSFFHRVFLIWLSPITLRTECKFSIFSRMCLSLSSECIQSKVFFQLVSTFETASLPHKGMGKVCVHASLRRHHLWDYTGYVVVVSTSIVMAVNFHNFLDFYLLIWRGWSMFRYCPLPVWMPG